MSSTPRVRTRFAPSPTGYLHIGGLRTALYCYLFAKHYGGDFILRIEDTDQERLVPGAQEQVLETLKRVGIVPDECDRLGGKYGPYIQSKRLPIYKQHAEILLEKGEAYYCFCSQERLAEVRQRQQQHNIPPMYDGYCRTLDPAEVKARVAAGEPHVVRLKVPREGVTEFTDVVWGNIRVPNTSIDDQILMKADGFPTYHLAVVVDDHLMEISHIMRGEEWIPSTSKHVLLYQAFGWSMPVLVHLPTILNKDRTKLSKRQGDVAAEDFLAAGYLPEAIVNFVALIGWHPGAGETEEIFSMAELIKRFSLEHIHKAGAIFSQEKLNWINSYYIRALPIAELAQLCGPYLESLLAANPQPAGYVEQVIKLEQERMEKLGDIAQLTEYFFVDTLTYPTESLVWKKSTAADATHWLTAVQAALDKVDDWSQTGLEQYLRQWIVDQGASNGDILWPLRVALTSRDKSPNPFEVAAVLGKQRSLSRIAVAVSKLQALAV